MFRKTLSAAACLSLLAACGPKSEASLPAPAPSTAAVGDSAVGAISTADFLNAAATADMFGIETARMALERSTNAGIRTAAQAILADHVASAKALKALVSNGRVEGVLPVALDQRRRDTLSELRRAADRDFDGLYLDQQIMAHHEGLLLMTGYKAVGELASLRAFAAEAAPRIAMRIDMLADMDADSQ